MKITLILVGKTTDKLFANAIEEYRNRINHYVRFEIITIPDIKNTKNLSEEQQKTAEGEQILNKLSSADTLILLDEHGDQYRSIEFAAWLQKQYNVARHLVFVIGGPYGFSDKVYRRADGKIALSRMTFSHQMVRLVFTEQLYRACTIIKGEPYHHE